MSDLIAVTMPKWGLSMEEGIVQDWHVEEGAGVEKGDELVDVETSKIANAVEAPRSGTLLRKAVESGAVHRVGDLLAVLGPADTDGGAVDAFVAGFVREEPEALEEDAAAQTQRVIVDGREIAYTEAGEGDSIPVLLVHGFSGDKDNWLFNRDALAAERRTVAIDLPGHGESAKDVGAGDADMLAGVILGIIDELGLSGAVVIGHSMGGGAAIAAAAKAPDRIGGLVLLSSFGLGGALNRSFIDDLLAADRRKGMKDAMRSLFADESLVSRDMVNDMLAYKRIDGVQAALDALALNMLTPESNAALKASYEELDVPVLVLHGADDAVIAVPEGVDAVPLEAAGHMPHMEASGEVNKRVAAFIAALGS